MPYRMAGIDVHKKRLVVVVADVELRAIVLQNGVIGNFADCLPSFAAKTAKVADALWTTGVMSDGHGTGMDGTKLPITRVVSMGRRNTQLRPTFIENKS
jgi:hypothetical protein